MEGFQVEIALDGETGLKVMRTFQPDLIILDLMLPQMSGVDVIRQIRSEDDFSRVPVIVFSNTYLTNLIQEAWKAGATKCLSKASCSPKEVLELVRHTIGDSGTIPHLEPPVEGTHEKKILPGPALASTIEADTVFQVGLQKSFAESLPATLATLRAGLQSLVKADGEVLQLKQIYELHRRMHALTGNAGISGLLVIAKMSDAIEALLKELYEKPKYINPSTLRTVATSIDFLGFLFERGIASGRQEIPAVNVLVVDDEERVLTEIDRQLRDYNVELLPASRAKEAERILTDTYIDAAIVDIRLHGKDAGIEVAPFMKASQSIRQLS